MLPCFTLLYSTLLYYILLYSTQLYYILHYFSYSSPWFICHSISFLTTTATATAGAYKTATDDQIELIDLQRIFESRSQKPFIDLTLTGNLHNAVSCHTLICQLTSTSTSTHIRSPVLMLLFAVTTHSFTSITHPAHLLLLFLKPQYSYKCFALILKYYRHHDLFTHHYLLSSFCLALHVLYNILILIP